ncbi:MAG: MASE3 domain-containing protein [Dictyoglomaceae bacterium]
MDNFNKRKFFTHLLVIFILCGVIFWRGGYNYITHLFFELSSVFLFFFTFLMLITIPQWKRTYFLYYLGTFYLASAILDVPHAIYYEGFPGISNTSLSVFYWMLARFYQSLGMFISSFYIYKELKEKRFFLLFFVPLSAFIFVLIPSYLPAYLFYNPFLGTTPLKSGLEVLYSLAFLTFALRLRKEFPLLVGSLSLVLSELSFMRYAHVFQWNLMLGHMFKLVGLFSIFYYIAMEFVYKPLLEFKKLTEEYSANGKESLSKILDSLKESIEFISYLLTLKSSQEILEEIKKFFRDENKTIPLAVFIKDSLFFKNSFSLPEKIEDYNENFERIELEDLGTVFLEKTNEFSLNLYKIVILSIFSLYSTFETMEYREKFIKNISHEFRNPLYVIFGYLELLKQNTYGKLSERGKEVINEIELSTQRINEIVDKISELFR